MVWSPVLRSFLQAYSDEAEALNTILTRDGLYRLDTVPHQARLCSAGDAADCFWLIIDGEVDVVGSAGQVFQKRKSGELIGEQAFLLAQTPSYRSAASGPPGRTAALIAHGTAKVLRFDAEITDRMSAEERALWYGLLANVVNEKLFQATKQRVDQADQMAGRNRLLARFSDTTALGLVEASIDGEDAYTSTRSVIVWFSDVAGFSGWSRNRSPAEVAMAARALIGLQIKLIRTHSGEIDKIMGDGLMAYWFCDGASKVTAPRAAVTCAKQVVAEFARAVAGTEMSGLSLRVGLHFGPACFGDFGTEERIAVTVLGETVNLAARYEQLRAEPDIPDLGPVRISATLYDVLMQGTGEPPVTLRGPVEARVKQDRFPVYWIVGE